MKGRSKTKGRKTGAAPKKRRPTAPRRPVAAAARPAPASAASRAAEPPRVRPLRDRVLLRRIEESEQRVGGLIVPDTAREKPQQAEVIAVGSGRLLDTGERLAPALRAGDRVLVGKWSGTEVEIAGQEYLILKEDEILGILG